MGYPHPDASRKAPLLVPRGATSQKALLVPKGVGAELQPARRPKGGWEAGTRIVSVMLAMLLAVTMLPAAGLQVAYADEPVERPATSGGDVALESTNGDNTATASQAPIAEARQDGMLAADGLTYTVADGGLSLVGFDCAPPEGALAVPAAVSVDGKDTSVVAIGIAEGQVADEVVTLSLPQGIKDIDTGSLAAALPALFSVEIAAAAGSSLPAASGAASMRAAYSTSGGMLFRPTTVTFQNDDGSIETIECKELLWAPPALVSARVPVECRAIAEGAFADARGLKTVVAFGTMERIADGAFSTDQMEGSKVVVPASSPAVTEGERVSASMALMGDAGQKERRRAWHEAGWRSDDIVMGKPCGSLTETVAVDAEGHVERTDLQLVSYPGAHENAMDLKKPNAEGVVEQADNGLAFTVKSDMTVSVAWQGDKTATPSHIEIPATITIDDVTYPVTEIAASAFEGAVFLTSISIPEGAIVIGEGAFENRIDLRRASRSSMTVTASSLLPESADIALASLDDTVDESEDARASGSANDLVSPYATTDKTLELGISPNMAHDLWPVNSTNVTYWATKDAPWSATLTYTGSEPSIFWTAQLDSSSQLRIHCMTKDHGQVGGAVFSAPSGWGFVSASTGGWSGGLGTQTNWSEIGHISLVRIESLQGYPLLSQGSLAGNGVASTVSRSDHNHDGTYAKATDLGNYVTTSALDGRNYITKAVSDLDNFYDKAKFNTISYEGLDEADFAGALPTFYVSDAAKTPTVPEPRREGHEFLGWTWSGQGAPTKDVSAAFAGGGAVTLTANWSEVAAPAPEARYFFTEDVPLRADGVSGLQEHVIKVRLSGVPKTLSSVGIEGNDKTGLVRDASRVEFMVGRGEDVLASGQGVGWGSRTPDGWSSELADLGDGSYGLYVGIRVPTDAIDAGNIVSSYVDGSYVASLVKLSYAFA